MDKDWRAQTDASSKPMIDAVMGSSLSKYLRQQQEATQGTATEIFVMDNRGLNVGQSEVTSDRSEEHTSELQSLMRISYAVFCLKKKNMKKNKNYTNCEYNRNT